MFFFILFIVSEYIAFIIENTFNNVKTVQFMIWTLTSLHSVTVRLH